MAKRTQAALLGLALLAGCTSEPGGFGSPPAPTATPDGAATSSPAPPSPARDVEVSTPGYRYDPAALVVAPGESIVLILTNPDALVHTLTINELSLQMTANPGETVRLPVEAPRAVGSYVMYCSTSGHLERGHQGRFEVR